MYIKKTLKNLYSKPPGLNIWGNWKWGPPRLFLKVKQLIRTEPRSPKTLTHPPLQGKQTAPVPVALKCLPLRYMKKVRSGLSKNECCDLLVMSAMASWQEWWYIWYLSAPLQYTMSHNLNLHRTNIWTPMGGKWQGRWWWWDESGDWDWHIYTNMYKMDN